MDLPVHPHSKLFVCVEGFCSSGLSSITCVPMTTSLHPNLHDKNIVYDLDSKSSVIDGLQNLKHSMNIGNKLKAIADLELDVADSTVSLSGYIQGAGQRNITWYLMKDAHVPNSDCSGDSDCLLESITNGGLVSFQHASLTDDTVIYICAHSESVTIHYELHSVSYPELSVCSDGVLIDDRFPAAGLVLVHMDTPGYITANLLSISWEGFSDSAKYETIGYPSAIAGYEYGIGMNIYLTLPVIKTYVM